MTFIILLLLVLGVAFRATTPEERARVFQRAAAFARQAREAAADDRRKCEPFRDALRARTPWALVTPVVAALNVGLFGLVLFGPGSLNDPQTLVAWGGSLGPLTTNGGWWRLVTSMFLHSGMLQLIVNVACLLQIGLVLERIVGSPAFAVVYVVAGLFAGLVNVSAYPVAVSHGASGAIFGLCGLLLALSGWGILFRASATIPLMAAKRIGLAAGVFVLFNLVNGGLGVAAELTGLAAGAAAGLGLASGLGEHKPPARRIGGALATAVVVAAAVAVPLRGVADVKPEIERVVAIELRTAADYQTAADRFRKGRMTADALAQVIERTIVPELQAADTRLKALNRVPDEHQPLVADAEEFLRLRSESWRLRAEALRKTNVSVRDAGKTAGGSDANSRLRAEAQYRSTMLALGKAEGTERASLAALEKIKPSGLK